MTQNKPLIETSKKLSWLLRHGAAEEGLNVDTAGWVPIDQVLGHLKLSKDELLDVVENNTKNRLQIANTRIRACQGHSTETMPVTLDALEASWKIHSGAGALWHGTNFEALEKIAEKGLLPVKRTHVHLAPTEDSLVGKRHNTPILLEVSSMLLKEKNINIYEAPNGVVLVRAVPKECIVSIYPVTKSAQKNRKLIEELFAKK